MQLVAIILSAIFAGIGAIGMLWPASLLEAAREVATQNGLLVAAAVRIVYGASLLLAAQESRSPNALRLFGLVVLIAGLATPFFGVGAVHGWIAALAADGGARMRIVGTAAVALGSAFVWALTPKGSGPQQR